MPSFITSVMLSVVVQNVVMLGVSAPSLSLDSAFYCSIFFILHLLSRNLTILAAKKKNRWLAICFIELWGEDSNI